MHFNVKTKIQVIFKLYIKTRIHKITMNSKISILRNAHENRKLAVEHRFVT